MAAFLYGAARFPFASTLERKSAYKKHIECFVLASRTFKIPFERREFHTGSGPIPVHLYARSRNFKNRPLVLLTGGVDTFKVELHKMASIFALMTGAIICCFDMPGTGENPVALAPENENFYTSLIDQLRSEFMTTTTASVGISFGGHWAAKLALLEKVDCAIDIGGPVGAIPLDHKFFKRLPNGMSGIVANAMGLEVMPSETELDSLLKDFSLKDQGILYKSDKVPLLAFNGDSDPYILREETLCFRSRMNSEVILVRNTSHCAAEKLKQSVPFLASWLNAHLSPSTAHSIATKLFKVIIPELRIPELES